MYTYVSHPFCMFVSWLPFLSNTDLFFQVVNRIFPVQRGLYEVSDVVHCGCDKKEGMYFITWFAGQSSQLLVCSVYSGESEADPANPSTGRCMVST